MNGRVVSTIAVAAALSAFGAGPAAGAVGHEVNGLVTDMRLTDGGVRLASAYPTRAVDARVLHMTLTSGSPVAGLALRSSSARGWVTPALTADGAVIAYAFQRSSKAKPVVQVVTVDGSGDHSQPETISAPGVSAEPLPPVVVGPTGAVAVRFTRGGAKSAIQYLAVRRASAAEFGGAKALGTSREARYTDFHVLLGPDGGGVLVGVPKKPLPNEPYARRITPEGELGPRIATGIGRHDETTVAYAFGPTGTFILAAATVDDLPDGSAGSVRVTSLPAGAGAFTPVREVATSGISAPDRDNLSIAVGDGDQLALTATSGTHDLSVIEGTPAGIARTATIDAQFPFDARVFRAVDGALSVVWSDIRARGEMLVGPPRIRATRRGPGGVFATPHTALKPRSDSASLSHAELLRDGRVAIVVERFDAAITSEASLRSLVALIQP